MTRNELMNEKKKVSILVGICSGQGLEERRNAVRDSWLRHPQEGVECLFFIGGEAAEEERGDTVGLDAPDTYNGLPAKVLAFFRYGLEHYDFDWIFKCDDDTYLDLSRLPELADSRYGLIGDALLGERKAPSGGAGYFLSRAVVEEIVARPDVPLTGAEDLIFGKLALETGAEYLVTPRLFLSNVRYPLPDNDTVTAHWCIPSVLRAMDVLRHGTPAAVYRGIHPHWDDSFLFYREGVFRRASSPDFGWWKLGGETRDTLTLAWKRWDPMELEWKGENFQGPSVTLARLEGSRSLWELPPPDEGALE